jgi:hypothetical protein
MAHASVLIGVEAASAGADCTDGYCLAPSVLPFRSLDRVRSVLFRPAPGTGRARSVQCPVDHVLCGIKEVLCVVTAYNKMVTYLPWPGPIVFEAPPLGIAIDVVEFLHEACPSSSSYCSRREASRERMRA